MGTRAGKQRLPYTSRHENAMTLRKKDELVCPKKRDDSKNISPHRSRISQGFSFISTLKPNFYPEKLSVA